MRVRMNTVNRPLEISTAWEGRLFQKVLLVHRRSPLFTTMVKKGAQRAPRPSLAAEDDGMKRLTISLPAALYAELERIAVRDSRSLGWVIRKGAEELVKQEQPLFHR